MTSSPEKGHSKKVQKTKRRNQMKIDIKGPIINDSDQVVYDYFQMPATSPMKIANLLENATKGNEKEVTVSINSGGGTVFAASEIYTELRNFKGSVNVQIVGVAASAASVIAMAGNRVEMSPTAQMMIHNGAMQAQGDYRAMDKASAFLKNTDSTIMNAYQFKTGKSKEELKAMMDKETWMTAQQAKKHGFIDNIMFEKEAGATASTERPDLINGILPQTVIDKVRSDLLHDSKIFPNTVSAANAGTNENTEKKSPVKGAKEKGINNNLGTPQHTEKEGKDAVKAVKAMKFLKEKGIDTKGMPTEEMMDIHNLVQAFSNIKQ